MNEAENRALFPEMMYNEIPHGKQNWYVQNSGIWQGVRLEFCPSIYIERLDVTPTGLQVISKLEARLAGLGLTAEGGCLGRDVEMHFKVFERSGRVCVRTSSALGSIVAQWQSSRVQCAILVCGLLKALNSMF